jgi:pyrimidine deaminase RibD-like protein
MTVKAGLSARQEADDRKFMNIALKLSRKGLGYTEPNPLVGAVVVKNGKILASGFHRAFGAPHAEAMALEHLAVPGTTLYLTLEPCAHFGKTPPCVDLIIAKKVRRVVMAMRDPNPLVDGRGIRKLREHGIQTRCGLCREQAERINRHYLKAIRSRMPYVTLHAGVSLDGKLTDDSGRSRWMTSEEGRRYSHSLRGEFSAILAGHGTILADNPRLTLREAGWEGKPCTGWCSIRPTRFPGACIFSRSRKIFRWSFSVPATPRTGKRRSRCIFSCAMTPTASSWPTSWTNCPSWASPRCWWKEAGGSSIPSSASGCSTRWPCSFPARSSAAGTRSSFSPPVPPGSRKRWNWSIAAGANSPAATS